MVISDTYKGKSGENRQDVKRLVYENEFFMEPRLQQVLMANQQVSVSAYK